MRCDRSHAKQTNNAPEDQVQWSIMYGSLHDYPNEAKPLKAGGDDSGFHQVEFTSL
jgi:hypothetical protein